MINDLKKALGPKKSIDPLEKEAKLSALKGMKKAAGDVMTSGYKDSMNKVTVAAPDKESLVEGLDKAEDVLENTPDEMLDGEDQAEDLMEACDTPEKIDEMMKKLMEKKLALESSQPE